MNDRQMPLREIFLWVWCCALTCWAVVANDHHEFCKKWWEHELKSVDSNFRYQAIRLHDCERWSVLANERIKILEKANDER